jgi:Tol biopolymer transport system component
MLAVWTLLVLSSIGARAEPPADEGQIYVSATWQPPDGKASIHVMAIDSQTGKCKTIVERGLEPHLSPDGRIVAYWYPATRQAVPNGQAREVWVKPIEGEGEPRNIWSGVGASSLCWTRDGKHVIVDQSIPSADRKNQHTAWLVDHETSEASQLQIPATDYITDSARMSDRLLATSVRNGRAQVFSLLRDGTQPIALTDKAEMAYKGQYSFDDQRILFMTRKENVLSVCTADADGRNVRVVFQEKGLTSPQNACWSPDAKHLAVVLVDWVADEQGRKVERSDEDNRYRIMIIDPDGANARELQLDRAVRWIGYPNWR